MNSEVVYAFIVALTVGPASGYIGSIMVSRHMALVGDALSHVALPGLALGILFNFYPFFGAFAFLITAMVATWYLQKTTKAAAESIIGVIFVLALAVGILITPEPDLMEALFGDVSRLTLVDVAVTAAVAAVVIVVTRKIYQSLILSMISEDLALSSGVKVQAVNLAYLLVVATVVAIGIKEVGTILVGAVVIVPAVAAGNVSESLKSYTGLSIIFGGASAIAGVAGYFLTGIPAGPLVVISGTVIFLLTFFIMRAVRKNRSGDTVTKPRGSL